MVRFMKKTLSTIAFALLFATLSGCVNDTGTAPAPGTSAIEKINEPVASSGGMAAPPANDNSVSAPAFGMGPPSVDGPGGPPSAGPGGPPSAGPGGPPSAGPGGAPSPGGGKDAMMSGGPGGPPAGGGIAPSSGGGKFGMMSAGPGGPAESVSQSPVAGTNGFGALFPQPNSGSANSGGPAPPSFTGASTTTDNQPEVTTPTYFSNAETLFANWNEAEAVNNLYGYMLYDEKAFEKYPLQWYTGLSQPRIFLRWGIGVEFSGDKDYSGIPPLIGDAIPEQSNGISSPQNNTNQASRYSNVDVSKPAGFLLYFTGDYVERLYKRLNDRRNSEEAYFGSILKDLKIQRTSSDGANTPLAPTASDVASPVASQAAGPAVPDVGGPPAGGGGVKGGGGKGDMSGGGGSFAPAGGAVTNVMQDGPIELLKQYGSTSAASRPSDRVTGTLLPGVMCIGQGKTEELTTKAASMNLDVLFVFEVKVSESRKKYFSNVILRVIDPSKPDRELIKAKALRNTNVMEDRLAGKSEPVEKELDKIFQEFVDKNFKASDMPEMKPEHVESRVSDLLKNPGDKLRSAVEVMGYYRVGLLPAPQAQSAIDELLGGGGQLLVLGEDQNEKRKFIDDLIAENSKPNTGGFR